MTLKVEVTKALPPEMQALADRRAAVRTAEAEVERLKGELKTARSVWETEVAELMASMDAAIEAQRNPQRGLFDGVADGDASGDVGGDAGGAATPGGVEDAEYTVNPAGVASLPSREAGEDDEEDEEEDGDEVNDEEDGQAEPASEPQVSDADL